MAAAADVHRAEVVDLNGSAELVCDGIVCFQLEAACVVEGEKDALFGDITLCGSWDRVEHEAVEHDLTGVEVEVGLLELPRAVDGRTSEGVVGAPPRADQAAHVANDVTREN